MQIKFKYNIHTVNLKGLWLLLFLSLMGCKKFISVDPPDSRIIRDVVFNDTQTADAVIAGIYHEMYAEDGFGGGSINSVALLGSLSGDELIYHLNLVVAQEFYDNQIVPINAYNLRIWSSAYNIIYLANSAIEGLRASESIIDASKRVFEGESRFIRAFCYFYLTNLYGNVPLILTTDYKSNMNAKRVPQSEVYDAIVEDLRAAQELLLEDYSQSKGERVRVNKGAATALLARVFLYLQDWSNAKIESGKLIEDVTYQLEEDLKHVFVKDSHEAIWQLMPTAPSANTTEATRLIITTTPVEYSLNNALIDSFESGDLRKIHWIGTYSDPNGTFYYPYKYKIRSEASIVSEYSVVLRLAEQYLIRAEALANLGDLMGSVADIDTIRIRAGLQPFTNVHPDLSKEMLLLEIERERNFEFFTEWGHRWLDLKRTKRAGQILSVLKPLWEDDHVLYPIPENELLNNPNLLPQNTGY